MKANKLYTVTATCTRMNTPSDDIRRIEELHLLLMSGAPMVSDLMPTDNIDLVGIVVMEDHKIGVVVQTSRGVEVIEARWDGDAERFELLEKQGSLAKASSMQYLESVTIVRYWLEQCFVPVDRSIGAPILGSKVINAITMAKENVEDFATGFRGFIRRRVAAF